MNLEVEELPASEISVSNFQERCNECDEYFKNQQWYKFTFLFKLLSQFISKTPNIPEISVECVENMRKNSKEEIIEKLNKTTDLEEFQIWLTRLSEIVVDRKELWDIMHFTMEPEIKVTLHESHEIAVAYFTPTMLFEFGIKIFSDTTIGDFNNASNEEAVIDIFYGLAGFTRACALDTSYETMNQDYFDYVSMILNKFIEIEDFDPQRLVWLVEAINANMHIPSDVLKELCLNMIENIDSKGEMEPMRKLHKLCCLTTSPFMEDFQLLKDEIDKSFDIVIENNRTFLKKYVLSCFITLDFTEKEVIRTVSLPVKCWVIYIVNLSSKLTEMPELPTTIMSDMIDNSLVFFEAFYGDTKPSRQRAVGMRADILKIATAVAKFYPGELTEESKKRVWYLLFIAAFSGASEDEIKGFKLIEPTKPNTVFLGLEYNDTGFIDYSIALGTIGSMFSEEKDDFPQMATFIRENYV